MGGVHLSIYPKETLTHHAIDYAVTGEAEVSLPELLHALTAKKSLRSVNGIAYRDGEEVVVTPHAATVDVD